MERPIQSTLMELRAARKELGARMEALDRAIAALEDLDGVGVRDRSPRLSNKPRPLNKPLRKHNPGNEPAENKNQLGELSQSILQMVRKGPPRTSGEIFEELTKNGFTGESGKVYAALQNLKRGSYVVSHIDESDATGLRRWYPG